MMMIIIIYYDYDYDDNYYDHDDYDNNDDNSDDSVIMIISTISSTEMDAGEGDWKLSIPTIKKRINWRRKGFMSGSDDN